MTLFEINKKLMNCFYIPDTDETVDAQTGEIFDGDYLDKLEMAKDEKIANIILFIKNLRSEEAAYKAQEDAFKKKRTSVGKKADHLEEYLNKMLGGQAWDKDPQKRGCVTFRKSEVVECDDITKLTTKKWNGYLRYKAPELDKTAIKKALKEGIKVPKCHIVEKMNMQIK